MRCWVVLGGTNADTCVRLGQEFHNGDFHGEMEAKAKMNW